jgi:hypothetical protein
MLSHCGRDILAGAIDYVGCSSSTDRFHTLAARNSNDARSAIGQQRHEHSTDGARCAPDYRGFVSNGPNTRETSRRQTGYRQTSAILEAKAVGNRRQHEGRRDNVRRARSENRSPADPRADGQTHTRRPRDHGACALSADCVWERQPHSVGTGTNQGFSMIESDGCDFDQRLTGLKGIQVLHDNLDDIRSAWT